MINCRIEPISIITMTIIINNCGTSNSTWPTRMTFPALCTTSYPNCYFLFERKEPFLLNTTVKKSGNLLISDFSFSLLVANKFLKQLPSPPPPLNCLILLSFLAYFAAVALETFVLLQK